MRDHDGRTQGRWAIVPTLRDSLLVVVGIAVLAGVLWAVSGRDPELLTWPEQLVSTWQLLEYVGTSAAAMIPILLTIMVVGEHRRSRRLTEEAASRW